MSCHILIWFVVTVRTTSIDLFTAPAAFFFFSILWPNCQKKNFFFMVCIPYRYIYWFSKMHFVRHWGRLYLSYIYFLMNFDWTFYCDFFTEKWVRKWYPASLKDKKTVEVRRYNSKSSSSNSKMDDSKKTRFTWHEKAKKVAFVNGSNQLYRCVKTSQM